MKNMPVPYLCGGTFFVLLTEAKGKKATKRQLRTGVKERITYKNMLEALIQMLDKSFEKPPAGRTFEGDTSDYRSCKVSYGENLPFDDKDLIESFDERVKMDYSSVVSDMNEYIDSYLRTDKEEKMQWLLQALLTLVNDDSSITDETVFYLDGEEISKAELLSLDHFCLSSLMLALWHYIVVNRSENELGRDTFKAWHERADVQNAKWIFNSNIGKSYPKQIAFDLFFNAEETKKGPTITAEPEDANYQEETNTEPTIEVGPEKTQTQILNNQGRIYNQHAEKIYNIEHIDVFKG